MFLIYVDTVELNSSKPDEDKCPIMIKDVVSGDLKHVTSVSVSNGRVAYYPEGRKVGDDIVRVAVEAGQVWINGS